MPRAQRPRDGEELLAPFRILAGGEDLATAGSPSCWSCGTCRPSASGPRRWRSWTPPAAWHTLRTKLPANLPVVLGDPDKVEQILTNLVGDAIKYSPGGGEVLVTVDVDGDTVQVSVRDQGIGMSPRYMGQLFEKFYRVDREEVRRAGGTGLGLYITKRLVEMHGGRLWAESWPGAGSVFRFTLPTFDELAGSGR